MVILSFRKTSSIEWLTVEILPAILLKGSVGELVQNQKKKSGNENINDKSHVRLALRGHLKTT